MGRGVGNLILITRHFPGFKPSISFDEATVVGSDPYITLNIHHLGVFLRNSRIAPLGLIRIEERATGENLEDLIRERLSDVGLSTEDLAAATTDGGSNELKAVQIIGLERQIKAQSVKDQSVTQIKALAFDVEMLSAFSSEVDEEANAQPGENLDDDGITDSVTLREAVMRLREVCRFFKKRPRMMDELRNVT